jgi:carbon storage regulator
MLVLTRLEGERIVIGDSIIITLIEVRGGEKARIGIDAPDNVVILREELLDESDRPVPVKWKGRRR